MTIYIDTLTSKKNLECKEYLLIRLNDIKHYQTVLNLKTIII
jgi:hypothetical protein